MAIQLSNNKQERLDYLLQQINIHTRITYSEMSKTLDISEDTIRRDINELAEEGKLIKIKGGAMALAYSLYHEKEPYAIHKKKIVAEKVLNIIRPNSLVLIGGGTTLWEFIKIIPDEFSATFLTMSVLTAAELLHKPKIKTIFLGGRISQYSQMAVTGDVYHQLLSIKPDYCILGTNAIDAQQGLTDSDWDTVQIKKEMINCAKTKIILAISEKLDSTMPLQIAPLASIDFLVTELDPNDTKLDSYRQNNINLL